MQPMFFKENDPRTDKQIIAQSVFYLLFYIKKIQIIQFFWKIYSQNLNVDFEKRSGCTRLYTSDG